MLMLIWSNCCLFLFGPTVDVDVDGVGVVGGCEGFFFFFFCDCGGSGWWLVVAIVGGCGGCGMSGWMWWPAVVRTVRLKKRETERERKNKK